MLNLRVPRRIANRAVKLGSDPSPLLHGVEQAIAARDRRRHGHHDRHHRAPDAHEPIRAREQLSAHLDAVAATGIERPHARRPEPSEHDAGLDRVKVVAVDVAAHGEVCSLDRSVTEREAHVGVDPHANGTMQDLHGLPPLGAHAQVFDRQIALEAGGARPRRRPGPGLARIRPRCSP